MHGLSVVAYTERVAGMCAALFFFVLDEFILWYVPPDVIMLARQLSMAMKIALRPPENVLDYCSSWM